MTIDQEKLVPTEIFQSAQTWTILQTRIPKEISSEFTPLKDQSVLFQKVEFDRPGERSPE